jgi:hypothetical protein
MSLASAKEHEMLVNSYIVVRRLAFAAAAGALFAAAPLMRNPPAVADPGLIVPQHIASYPLQRPDRDSDGLFDDDEPMCTAPIPTIPTAMAKP